MKAHDTTTHARARAHTHTYTQSTHTHTSRRFLPVQLRGRGTFSPKQALSMETAYLDPRTGATYPLSTPRWCGDGQSPLLLTPLPGITRADILRNVRSLWRYSKAFPFVPENPITMGEGCTPLLPRDIAGCRVHLKCEWFMPTGSFKDRGATVMLSLLRAQGATHVLEHTFQSINQ